MEFKGKQILVDLMEALSEATPGQIALAVLNLSEEQRQALRAFVEGIEKQMNVKTARDQ